MASNFQIAIELTMLVVVLTALSWQIGEFFKEGSSDD